MSQRTRSPVFAVVTSLVVVLVTFLILGLVYSEGRRVGQGDLEKRRNIAAYEAHSEEQLARCGALSDDIIAARCAVEILEATNEHLRSERDVVAQTDMARWTFWMLVVAFFSFGVSAVGVWFIRQTLIQADETNRAAVAAAEAANQANMIARQEQRPWVTVRWEVPCSFEVLNEGSACKIEWLYDFENLGRSPAFNIRHEWGVYRLDTMYIAAGVKGRNNIVNKAKSKMLLRSNTPVLFPSEKTEHLWPIEGHRRIEGEQKGSLFLCCCLTYALDQEHSEFALEARVYQIEEANDLPEARTHEILRIPQYDHIATWKV